MWIVSVQPVTGGRHIPSANLLTGFRCGRSHAMILTDRVLFLIDIVKFFNNQHQTTSSSLVQYLENEFEQIN